MPRSTVEPGVKAAAVADLLAGDQPAVVADRYQLDRNMVKQWKFRHVPASVPASVSNNVPIVPVRNVVAETQQRQFGELVLDLLRRKLEASEAIARAASDPAWIKQQTAAELATLGQWLDTSAFAIGDRLAAGRAGDAGDEPST